MKLLAAFDRCFRRTKTSFSACVYVRYERSILLLHHRRLGLWVPPGGSIEPNETPLDAVQRELFEETGLIAHFPTDRGFLSAGKIPGLVKYEELHDDPHKGVRMNFVFIANAQSSEIKISDEALSYRWVGRHCDGIERVPDNVRKNVQNLIV